MGLERRMGKFYVDEYQVRENLEAIEEILTLLRFVPYRAEHLDYIGKFEYIGTSPLFEPVDIGMTPPEYIITIQEDDEGNVCNAKPIKI